MIWKTKINANLKYIGIWDNEEGDIWLMSQTKLPPVRALQPT